MSQEPDTHEGRSTAPPDDGRPLSLLERLERPRFEALQTIGLLGAGGQALVYAAEGRTGRVAVKRWDAARAEVAARELAALRALAPHPGLVRLVGTTRLLDEDGEPRDDVPVCALLEEVPGPTLARALEEDGPLPPLRAAAVGVALARALAHLHARGLVHFDLKPSNVALRADGAPVVIDLGLAAPAGAAPAGGSPPYMAPEQFAGFADPETGRPLPHGPATDVYLLGATLFECVSGARPWAEDDGARARWAHAADVWSRARVAVPSELRRIIARCLAGPPASRYADATSVAADLERLLAAPRRVVTLLFVGAASPLPDATPERAQVEAALRRGVEDGGGRVAGGDAHELRATFDRPSEAATSALRLVHAQGLPGLRAAIHLGEVALLARDDGSEALEGEAVDVARRLLRAAPAELVLLTTTAFTEARSQVAAGALAPRALAWRALGRYRLPGLSVPERQEIVGWAGPAEQALRPPVESRELARAADSDDADLFVGPASWRPAPGAAVPDSPDFVLERRLGGGGGGEVWLARHRIHAQPLAVKFSFDAERVRQLRRERVIAQVLGRQGVFARRRDIARVEAAHLDGPPYYVVSEYTDGGDLHAWAERHAGAGQAPLSARARIVAAAARALAAAHDAGVLHRDVKPSNILLDAQGEVRISDFGIGRLTVTRERARDLAVETAALTEVLEANASAGTRMYLAPELLEGQAPTAQTDLYALGVVIYQLCCGDLQRALGEGWERDVERALAAEDADVVALLIDDVRACIERDPARRLRSMGELADRLDGLEARRQARLERRRSAARQRLLRWAGAIALAALVILLSLLFGDRARLAELRRLADVAVVDQLERDAARGWPVTSASAPAIDAWLASAADVVARLPEHREHLARLRARMDDSADARWERETLASLVARVTALEADGEERRGSLAWGRRWREVVARWESAWAAALPSIAMIYTGLPDPIAPQVGLVPLRVDPRTRLWELWHPETGRRPRIDLTARLVIDGETSLVFVLVPGGRARLGRKDGLPDQAPSAADLVPFFLSKYELTQGQWTRLTGSNPSRHQAGREGSVIPSGRAPMARFGPANPVEQVSWNACSAALGAVGLSLPTEAQWEWAARGEDDRRLPWGEAPTDLTRAVCLLRSGQEALGTCPVGLRPAGASWCGVEDLTGNVLEWCLDHYIESYAARPAEAGTGRRLVFPPSGWERAVRGGSWGHWVADSFLDLRGRHQPATAMINLGCRPARAFAPAGAGPAPFDPHADRVEARLDLGTVEPFRIAAGFEGDGDPTRFGFEGGHPFELDSPPGFLHEVLDVGANFPWALGRAHFGEVANYRTGWTLEARVHARAHRPDKTQNAWGAFLEGVDEHGGVHVLFLPDEVRVIDYGMDDRQAPIVVAGSGFRVVRVEIPAGDPAAGSTRRARVFVDGARFDVTLVNTGGVINHDRPDLRFGDGSRGAGADALWDYVRLTRPGS